ncbi:hypothetical protein JK628_00855 [Shewanella sp. KX20019]|uniref:hypothetical protein n=1 Tax=Shewanella sp. KX20019 TaxID=2803864 RepID=UPI00192669A8|nr:hypothetical protein [Shewanella sp. KX20019]QQX80463.1 hypothetical protein JK628_00855 [Shewanella sp. KX20019]
MLLRWGINSATALALLMGLWCLLHLQSAPPPPQQALQIRQLTTVALPVPPPPPPSQPRLQQNTAVDLQLSAAAAQVQLEVTLLDVPLPELSEPSALSNAPLVESIRFDTEALMTAITTFSLDELDEMPRLLTPISVRLPKQLRQQGVREALLQLHVIIHESGKVELVNVELAEYPELALLAQQIVNQARFSSPRRESSKVKAEFLWPLKVS